MARIQDVLFDENSSLQPDEMKVQLSKLAQEIVSAIVENNLENSQELLSGFVGELLMSATRQTFLESRRRKQFDGIAEAKAKGVAFGRKRNPLPENFERVRALWCEHELSLKDAAKMCGMPVSTFYDAARRLEEPAKNRTRKPLPENFEESRLLWRSHKLKMKEAAARCGMPPSTFYGAVQRVEAKSDN